MSLKIREFVVSLGIALFLAGCSPTPKDDYLLENFKQHRPEFSRVVQMLEEDRKLQHLWATGITPKDAIDKERWNEYRKLMSAIRVRSILANLGEESRVIISSVSNGRYDKGYTYSENRLDPQMESLDFKRGEVPPYHIYYKQIEGNWYLYYHNLSD